jgi:ABC-type Na+ efflux pump permease subunit
MLRAELARAFGWRHAVVIVCMALMGVVLAVWLPTLPESVFRFFRRVFQLPSWPEIAVANDMAGLFFFVYWIGVFDVLAIYVQPLEERRLDLVLSKPLTRAEYLWAKLVPIVLVVVALFLIGALAHCLALQAAGLAYPLRALGGANFALLAWTILLVCLINLIVLSVRDTYTALLVAFVPMLVTILPGTIYMYRPDIFESVPRVRDLVVFPLNLVWFQAFSANWGFLLGTLFLALAAGLVAAAGWTLEKHDVP